MTRGTEPTPRDEDRCPICRRGAPADVIADLDHTWVTAQPDAALPGYVCIVSKTHVREPFELPAAERAGFWRDVDRVAQAIAADVRPTKLNYEIHGNTLAHLHLHLYPRQVDDPFQGRPIDPRQTVRRSPEELAQLARALAPLAPGSGTGSALILVSGPPGAGKTSVSELLAQQFARSVHIVGDAFFGWVRGGFIAPWASGSMRQNEVVIESMTAAALRYSAGGYVVVLDCVIGPWHLDPILAAAAASGIPLHYVVLRPRSDIAFGRTQDRPGEALRDEAPILDQHRQFAELGSFEANVLDSSEMSVAETARQVADGVRLGRWLIPTT
jgi:diadenosine tetraphosphate (Ap4A) HIT family hydrolase